MYVINDQTQGRKAGTDTAAKEIHHITDLPWYGDWPGLSSVMGRNFSSSHLQHLKQEGPNTLSGVQDSTEI